jgi:MFS family permease
LFAIGNGLMWPSFLALLSKHAGGRFQGAVQGFSGSVGSLASIVGLLVGGIIYGLLGSQVFLISAGLAFLVALLALRLVGSSGAPE